MNEMYAEMYSFGMKNLFVLIEMSRLLGFLVFLVYHNH